MKKLLALSALVLLFGGCGQNDTVQEDGSLTDMFGGGTTTQVDTDTVDPEKVPYSIGPSEIPSDLIPND